MLKAIVEAVCKSVFEKGISMIRMSHLEILKGLGDVGMRLQ